MPDREKVKKGVWQCWLPSTEEEYATQCHDCPYYEPGITLEECMTALRTDALELLKEQETELICNLLGGQPYEVYCRECRTILCILGKGETMNDAKSIFNYCPHCGRSVK